MEKLVTLNIDGKTIEVPSTYTIMQAADALGINIPRLCFLKDINENASCRVCVVEIAGMRSLKNSCSVEVGSILNREGTATIYTNTPRVRAAVRQALELIAANHRFDCWKCPREHNCELLALLRRYSIDNVCLSLRRTLSLAHAPHGASLDVSQKRGRWRCPLRHLPT